MDKTELALWRKYKQSPTIANRNALAEQYLPLIQKWMDTRYITYYDLIGWDKDDQFGIAYSTLLSNLIPNFNLAHNVEFRTYAHRRLRGAIVDAYRIYRPGKRFNDPKIYSYSQEFKGNLHKCNNSDCRPVDPMDYVPFPPPDTHVEDEDEMETLLRPLNLRRRMVLRLRFRHDMSQPEIGSCLTMCAANVSQIITRAIIQMREKLGIKKPENIRCRNTYTKKCAATTSC